MAPIMIIVAPLTPRLSARFGANRTVAFGMGLVASRAAAVPRPRTPHRRTCTCSSALFRWSVGIALTMSPMTAAIMSAVPSRRAGAGSAMNDATRELGAALGVAVLGSIAASQYSAKVEPLVAALPASVRSTATSSIAGAIQAANACTAAAGRALTFGAQHAFVDGMHFAVTVGAVLAAVASVVVYRYLPRGSLRKGALHGPVESVEDGRRARPRRSPRRPSPTEAETTELAPRRLP